MPPAAPPKSTIESGGLDAMYRTVEALRLAGMTRAAITCRVAEEVPVGLHYNSIPHAVVMATPGDLEDLATGFSLTDGICRPDEITFIAQHPQDDGISVDIGLAPSALARFLQTRQQRATRSYTSCGICGLESIDQLPPTSVTAEVKIEATAIRLALAALPQRQALNSVTGAAHGAAWVSPEGIISLMREDVGRHNALDKLIGARARLSDAEQHGFCLLTSRCSYEMVQKATMAKMGLLVCISAPTGLALETARRSGLALVALARADSQTVYVGGMA